MGHERDDQGTYLTVSFSKKRLFLQRDIASPKGDHPEPQPAPDHRCACAPGLREVSRHRSGTMPCGPPSQSTAFLHCGPSCTFSDGRTETLGKCKWLQKAKRCLWLTSVIWKTLNTPQEGNEKQNEPRAPTTGSTDYRCRAGLVHLHSCPPPACTDLV